MKIATRNFILNGYATRSHKGYVFIRHGHDLPIEAMRTAISQAYEYGLLGKNLFGSTLTCAHRLIIVAATSQFMFDDPFYDRDYNLCIVCARCVRVCEEVRVDAALTLTERSGVALVGTARGYPCWSQVVSFAGHA